MERREFQDGELIFREGDAGVFVCRILSGEVELCTRVDGHRIVVGLVREGQSLGEAEVLDGLPRTATARARTDVSAMILGAQEYLEWLRETSRSAAFPPEADQEGDAEGNGRGQGQGPDPDEAMEYRIIIYPMSETLRSSLPSEGLVISTLPFTVGASPGQEDRSLLAVDLPLPDTAPSRLSLRHFSLERASGGLLIRDLGSRLGTAVNGAFLGRHFGTLCETVGVGAHLVVAGGVGSPFAFSISVQRRDASGPSLGLARTMASKEDPRWERLKEQVVDRARTDAWMDFEMETLHSRNLGRMPQPDGMSGPTLEAIGGIALGSLFGTLSVLMMFIVLVLFLHARLPQLF